MKHLKRFNEDNNTEVDLKDFCETNLAYLLDDNNFELSVDGFDSDSSIDGYLQVDNSQIRLENDLGFKWDDIKDYFIPFLQQLDKVCGDRIRIGDDKSIFVYTMDIDTQSYHGIVYPYWLLLVCAFIAGFIAPKVTNKIIR